jgi:hypothetical protein
VGRFFRLLAFAGPCLALSIAAVPAFANLIRLLCTSATIASNATLQRRRDPERGQTRRSLPASYLLPSRR